MFENMLSYMPNYNIYFVFWFSFLNLNNLYRIKCMYNVRETCFVWRSLFMFIVMIPFDGERGRQTFASQIFGLCKSNSIRAGYNKKHKKW